MAYDYYGRWIPDTGNPWDPRARQQTPPPGYSNYGRMPDPNAYNVQQPAGLSVTPKMFHADIVPIRSESDVHNDIVPPTGESRMYMSEDDRLIATKRVGPNGVETVFYDRRPDAPASAPIDPQNIVLRSELDGLVNRIIDARINQNAPAAQPGYEQSTARATVDNAGGRT